MGKGGKTPRFLEFDFMIGKIKAFAIYYSNRVEYGYTYEDWKNLPNHDVQLVLFFFMNGKRTHISGSDYYGLTEEGKRTFSNDTREIEGHMKYGKWTTDENIKRISDEATENTGEDLDQKWLLLEDRNKVRIEREEDI